MSMRETWKAYSKRKKCLILLRDLPLYAVLLSVLPNLLTEFDNSLLVLICLPVSAFAQATLSWKQDRKMALFFLFGAIFVFAMYAVSITG